MHEHSLFDQPKVARQTVHSLEQGLALFTTVGMPAHHLALRTRTEYQHDLADLLAFLATRGVTTLSAVKLHDLEYYQAEMDQRGYKPSTKERKVYAIKTFFRFLYRHGLIDSDVSIKLIPPVVEKSEPRYLSEPEYQALLDACRNKPRDRAIVELFLQTGMTLAELCRLTVYDIELPDAITPDAGNTGIVRVRRDSGVVDSIPLNYKACKALRAWLAVRPSVHHVQLFVTKRKTPMSKRAIQSLVERYGQRLNIRHVTVRTLRNTMAIHHAIRGTDPTVLKETLGHASTETTERYVAVAKKAQRRALQEHAL